MNKMAFKRNKINLKATVKHWIDFDDTNKIYNSRLLENYIIKENLCNKKFAIFFISIASFKQIYSAYGIEIGNKYLKLLWNRLTMIKSDKESLFKYVEDGFILFKSNYKDDISIIDTAEKIIGLNNEFIEIDGNAIFSVINVGISISHEDGVDVSNVLNSAVATVYKFKMHDKGHYKFSEKSTNHELVEELKRKTELRKAIESSSFSISYQLQIDTKKKSIHGVEALIRWNHPILGVISPMKFIPIAEETGLIVPIGKWILKEACKQNKKWQDESDKTFNIAINVSEVQLREEGFIKMISDTIVETRIKPEYIHIELTETILMTSFESNLEVLRELKNMGVKIVIDDFGIGYSSLNYLKIMPIDIIKIDKSFIDDICTSKMVQSIIREIIQICNEFNIDVIAEGVEKTEQLKILIEKGCNKIQGFLFAKPSAANEIEFLSNLVLDKMDKFAIEGFC